MDLILVNKALHLFFPFHGSDIALEKITVGSRENWSDTCRVYEGTAQCRAPCGKSVEDGCVSAPGEPGFGQLAKWQCTEHFVHPGNFRKNKI